MGRTATDENCTIEVHNERVATIHSKAGDLLAITFGQYSEFLAFSCASILASAFVRASNAKKGDQPESWSPHSASSGAEEVGHD